MRKYKSVEINESLLENMVCTGSEMIEEGLKYISHQKIPGKDPMDVLFVDSKNCMVAAELNIVEDDNMLLQGLDYYNYVANNYEILARTYKDDGIDPTRAIRLMLIAPSFSQTMTNRCRWIDTNISLYTYKCIKFNDSDEVIPIFSETSIPTPLEYSTEERDSFEDQLGYLTNRELRGILTSLLSDLPPCGKDTLLIEPIKYAISVKKGGKVFMHLALRRDNFFVETHSAEGKWTGYQVNSREDLETLMPLMKSNMERLK
jgi:hypothetical protein